MFPGRPSPIAWRLVCGACIVIIVLATTWPWADFQGHTHWGNVEWLPFSHRLRPADFLLNILLFVPLGFAARRAWPERPVWVWVVAGCALSVMVETYQLYSHSRFPTSVDVLANTAGAWLGARRRGPTIWQM